MANMHPSDQQVETFISLHEQLGLELDPNDPAFTDRGVMRTKLNSMLDRVGGRQQSNDSPQEAIRKYEEKKRIAEQSLAAASPARQ